VAGDEARQHAGIQLVEFHVVVIGQREHVDEHPAQRFGDLLGRCCGALVPFGDEHRPGELTYFLGQVEAAHLHRPGLVDRRERAGSSSHMAVHHTPPRSAAAAVAAGTGGLVVARLLGAGLSRNGAGVDWGAARAAAVAASGVHGRGLFGARCGRDDLLLRSAGLFGAWRGGHDLLLGSTTTTPPPWTFNRG
jgi:hypothetical protein